MRLRRRINFEFNLGWKTVEPVDSNQNSYNSFSAGIGFEYGRELYFRGKSSFEFGWRFGYSSRNYQNEVDIARTISSYNDTKNSVSAKAAYPVYKAITIAGKLTANNIDSWEKPLPLSERFYFGGTGSLRGYRNNQFSARRYLLLSGEMRLFASNNDYLYPFADYAYFEKFDTDSSRNISLRDDTKFGFGLGVALKSDKGQLNIELGWGEDSVIDEPRMSVTLSNRF